MMIKKTLLDQFDRSYNVNGWFVAVRNAVEGLPWNRPHGNPRIP
ncbi:hypothetical protein BH20ACI2_BH20ACI2_26190 [soil metagenome]